MLDSTEEPDSIRVGRPMDMNRPQSAAMEFPTNSHIQGDVVAPQTPLPLAGKHAATTTSSKIITKPTYLTFKILMMETSLSLDYSDRKG